MISRKKNVSEYMDLIEDSAVRDLIQEWKDEEDPIKKDDVRQRIIKLISQGERDAFFARFILHDFDSWNDVLNAEESKQYHTATFYREYLEQVLIDHPDGIEPVKAIELVKNMVYDQMLPGDFKISKSKRLRYDTMIRSIYIILKRNDLIMSYTRKGVTFWLLTIYRKNILLKNLRGKKGDETKTRRHEDTKT